LADKLMRIFRFRWACQVDSLLKLVISRCFPPSQEPKQRKNP
jgi:hypothetical protein